MPATARKDRPPTCDQLLSFALRQTGETPPRAARAAPACGVGIPRRIAVIGAGVKGLTTALELHRAFDAAKLRRDGVEPSITVFEQDGPTYPSRHRQGLDEAVLWSSASGARELLAHVPRHDATHDPPAAVPRLRQVAEGQRALDDFQPLVFAVCSGGGRGGAGTELTADNLPRNMAALVDTLLGDQVSPEVLAQDVHAYYSHMRHSGPGDACRMSPVSRPGVTRVLHMINVALGGSHGRFDPKLSGQTGLFWPVCYRAGSELPMPSTDSVRERAVWRCAAPSRTVLPAMAHKARSLGITVEYGRRVTASPAAGGCTRLAAAGGALGEFDLVVWSDGPPAEGRAALEVLLPDSLAQAYRRRHGDRQATMLHHTAPWALCTLLQADVLAVHAATPDTPGVLGRSFAGMAPEERVLDTLLQLGFSRSDAALVTLVHGVYVPPAPGPSSPAGRPPPPVDLGSNLVAFDVGAAHAWEPPPDRPAARVPKRGQLRLRDLLPAPVEGGIGGDVEGGKHVAQQVVNALELRDAMRSAAVSTPDRAGTVPVQVPEAYRSPGDLTSHPPVTFEQRWSLFNHLATRLGIGRRVYVAGIATGVVTVLLLVVLSVAIPLARHRRGAPKAAGGDRRPGGGPSPG